MKWEALALAALTQTLQVGLRPKPENPWCLSPSVPDSKAEAHCHCLCQCGSGGDWYLGALAGSVAGAGVAASCCGCCPLRRFGEPTPSPRRKGHGVVTPSIAWSDLGGLLRG